jgi:hypothetical protein
MSGPDLHIVGWQHTVAPRLRSAECPEILVYDRVGVPHRMNGTAICHPKPTYDCLAPVIQYSINSGKEIFMFTISIYLS